jgi:hypothetical protein
MAIFSQNVQGVLVKKEVTYGTDPTPVAADNGVRIVEAVWPNMDHEYLFLNERESASGGLLPIAPAPPKGRMYRVNLTWDGRGLGSAYGASDLPEASPLFQACGMSETVDATPSSESVTYTQQDSAHESCTIWIYADGKLFKLVGCRGTMRWPLNAGEFGKFVFEMQGKLSADPTTVSLPAITYDSTIPPTAISAGLSIAAWDPDVISAEFVLNAGVVNLPSANAADAIAEIAINAAKAEITANVFSPPLTDYNAWNVLDNLSAGANLDWTLGATQYNRIKMDVSGAGYIRPFSHASQDEFTTLDLRYLLTDYDIIFD